MWCIHDASVDEPVNAFLDSSGEVNFQHVNKSIWNLSRSPSISWISLQANRNKCSSGTVSIAAIRAYLHSFICSIGLIKYHALHFNFYRIQASRITLLSLRHDEWVLMQSDYFCNRNGIVHSITSNSLCVFASLPLSCFSTVWNWIVCVRARADLMCEIHSSGFQIQLYSSNS